MIINSHLKPMPSRLVNSITTVCTQRRDLALIINADLNAWGRINALNADQRAFYFGPAIINANQRPCVNVKYL